jgi:outer membrane immunogenic protein
LLIRSADFAYPWWLIMRRFQCALLAAIAVVGFASIASAADMPTKAPIRKAVGLAPISWTGCYVGANVGGGWGKEELVTAATANVAAGQDLGKPSLSGWIGGGQIGCDYQTGSWVFGVEGMFDAANIRGSVLDPAGLPTVIFGHTKQDWLGTGTARVGYAFDRALIYAKGGIAWTHYSRFYDNNSGLVIDTESDRRAGWVIGGGLEYMIVANWSVKAEYNYFNFGNPNEAFSGSGGPFVATIHDRAQSVTLGVNYRFGWRN